MRRGIANTLLVKEGMLFLRGAVAVPLSSEVKASERYRNEGLH